jgi:hypothetical protein
MRIVSDGVVLLADGSWPTTCPAACDYCAHKFPGVPVSLPVRVRSVARARGTPHAPGGRVAFGPGGVPTGKLTAGGAPYERSGPPSPPAREGAPAEQQLWHLKGIFCSLACAAAHAEDTGRADGPSSPAALLPILARRLWGLPRQGVIRRALPRRMLAHFSPDGVGLTIDAWRAASGEPALSFTVHSDALRTTSLRLENVRDAAALAAAQAAAADVAKKEAGVAALKRSALGVAPISTAGAVAVAAPLPPAKRQRTTATAPAAAATSAVALIQRVALAAAAPRTASAPLLSFLTKR